MAVITDKEQYKHNFNDSTMDYNALSLLLHVHQTFSNVSGMTKIEHNSINTSRCRFCHLPTCTRNSSGDEIANVNFLYDIVHAVKIQ